MPVGRASPRRPWRLPLLVAAGGLLVAAVIAAMPQARWALRPAARAGAGAGLAAGREPPFDVLVSVGALTQATLDAHPPGTTFKLAAGTHRLGEALVPRRGQGFVSAGDAVVSGAKVLKRWRRAGDRWFVEGQTQRLPETPTGGPIGSCRPRFPRCGRSEDVFLDGRLLRHVATLAEVRAGRYFFDYATDRIWIGDDPAGHVLEASVTPQAFVGVGGARDVAFRNIIVEMFGSHGQDAAIHSEPGNGGWRVLNSEVRWNHGVGVKLDSGAVRDSYVHHNGKFGLGGSGDGSLVAGNEIAFNNTVGYDRGAGGAKWVFNDGLVVRANYSHGNGGPGLWTDINNIDTRYEANRIEDNARAGIMHEVSYDAVIRGNIIRGNGNDLGAKWFISGAGVYVVNSPGVEVHDNLIAGNAAGVTGRHDRERTSGEKGRHGPTVLTDLRVHDNDVLWSGPSGIFSDDPAIDSDAGNDFRDNNHAWFAPARLLPG